MKPRVLTLLLFYLLTAASSLRLELHFESLCKQCQIHTAGLDDIVFHGGNENSTADAGMLAVLEMSVDYYGEEGCALVAKAIDSEHGPDMCLTDRYHLCAQEIGGGTGVGKAQIWWPFVHCMFMNMDQFKCGVNKHCDDQGQFIYALNAAVPMCAAVAKMDAAAIRSCALGDQGHQLAIASYRRTDTTLIDGFAPAYINSNKVEGADEIWRKTPDQLLYGQTMLNTLCEAFVAEVGDASSSSLPGACQGL